MRLTILFGIRPKFIIRCNAVTFDKSLFLSAAAKRDGIRHARFPMKQVLGLKAELNVETCVAIMADYKYSQVY